MDNLNKIRINKYLSQCGICSRREADRLLDQGKIIINGITAKKGDRVSDTDEILLDGKKVSHKEEEIIIAFNKPAGVVCTCEKKEKNNIIDYLDFPSRIYPVGRLDKESTGLILLTNNGQLMDDILRSRNNHEKEYEVKVNKPLKDDIKKAMEEGVPILGTITKPCKIKKINDRRFNIILTQGLNRQIRRMCNYFDLNVLYLNRIRIINIELKDLKEGQWRYLSKDEIDNLKRML